MMAAFSILPRSLILILVLAPIVSIPCDAGTGGIFSFSNRRKLQQNTLIESPTAIPQSPRIKSRISVPSFPSTPGGLADDGKPRKRSSKTTPLKRIEIPDDISVPVSTTDQHGSVESFFQVNSPHSYRATDAPVNKSIARLDKELNQPESSPGKSVVGAPLRFMWHVMDNAGVPMFFGKSDDDLDPSLRRGAQSLVPSPALSKPAATESGAATKVPHKIPESELEGTNHWVNTDDEMP